MIKAPEENFGQLTAKVGREPILPNAAAMMDDRFCLRLFLSDRP